MTFWKEPAHLVLATCLPVVCWVSVWPVWTLCGTYRCWWKSKYSGHFKTRILIDGEDVIGSPAEFTLISSTPELSKSEVLGDGLKSAVAGLQATIKIKFVDQFSNKAKPGPQFKFGMAINKDKDKVANAKAHKDFQGVWEPGETGARPRTPRSQHTAYSRLLSTFYF